MERPLQKCSEFYFSILHLNSVCTLLKLTQKAGDSGRGQPHPGAQDREPDKRGGARIPRQVYRGPPEAVRRLQPRVR